VLSYGTPAEVRAHVTAHVRALAPRGGFVFQHVHNILGNVPAENIIAMYEAVGGARRETGAAIADLPHGQN
jgi:uroporphyrinogen decarboxylase